VLIARGDAAERLLAFALLAVSMVNILMRYYHSRLSSWWRRAAPWCSRWSPGD
jgi:hypothetical protein